MLNKLHTFINIFDSDIEFEDGEKKFVRMQKIIIPIIQRDYAQGRNDFSINRVRKNFLNALYKAVTEKPITLDFVYGDIDDEGILTPLDGQQRLTTLFLLHWYAAQKDNISSGEIKFLENFSYVTRPDSREFCKMLINFKPTFCEENLSEEIKNQAWFPLSWEKDPTVSAMLNMLNAIHEKFFNVKNLWEKLKNGAISFYFLPIRNLGLTDEIYITMNSRGKPLTRFEHFKAEFKSRLDLIDAKYSTEIINKIDTVWTDLIWKYRDTNNLIDDGFLNYFRFICDVLLYKHGGTTQGKNRIDEFILLDEFFSGDNNEIRSNVQFMEKSFDCWMKIDDIEKFFSDKISCGSRRNRNMNRHSIGKIIIYYNEKNLFKNCLESYSRDFTLGKFLIFYAFLVYLLNFENILDKDFCRRIRIVNNLVINSEGSELSDSETRAAKKNRLPAMLRQVENIIVGGKISETDLNFNDYQIREEREKLIWTEKNPDKAESLFSLEDHYLLYGQIGIIGVGDSQYFEPFISLFKCDYDKINCVLLIYGDYFQANGKGYYQFGSNNPQSWQNLFHRSSLEGYENTQEALFKLFKGNKKISDKVLDEIIEKYLADCEKNLNFDWFYYYVKYDEFRPKKFGKYFWQDFENKPYELLVMLTNERRSSNAYQPFFKAAVSEEFFDKHYNKDFENPRIILEKSYIECKNDSFVIRNLYNNAKQDIQIHQHNGIDMEDRVEKLKRWIKKLL